MSVVGITQREGRVVGQMQLYSKDRGISQAIEGHAASFGTVRLEGAPADTRVFTFAVRTATSAKLHVVEIDHNPRKSGISKESRLTSTFLKKLSMIFPSRCRSPRNTV